MHADGSVILTRGSSKTVLTTFDYYLFRRYMHVFFVLFCTMFGLFIVIDGFTNIDSFQEGREGVGEIAAFLLTYYSCQSVVFFDMTGAILSVTAVMVVFALLLKHSELYPVLAAGVPTLRLMRPLVVGTVLVSGLLLANQELLIPRVYEMIQAPRSGGKEASKQIEPVYDRRTHVHLDGEKLLLGTGRMAGATIVLPTAGPLSGLVSELTTLKAEEATWKPAIGDRPSGWQMHQPSPGFAEIKLTEAGRSVVLPVDGRNDVFVVTDVSPNQLFNRNRNFKYMSTLELIDRLKRRASGVTSVQAQLVHLHSRLTMPLLNLVAIFVAVPLIVRRESRSLVVNMALSTGVLGMVYGATQLTLYLGQMSLIPADLAVWLPVVGGGSLGAWLTGDLLT